LIRAAHNPLKAERIEDDALDSARNEPIRRRVAGLPPECRPKGANPH
jgi:hypothetical protein